jgi:hypothetical protein
MDGTSTTRRELLALMAAFGAGAAPANAQDAVKVAPRNYRVAFENDKVRVLEYYSKPGVACVVRPAFPSSAPHFGLTDAKPGSCLMKGA